MLSVADLRRVTVLRQNKIKYPVRTVLAAKWAGLELARACALLQKESGNGEQLWGHDPTIFIGGYDKRNRHAYGPVVTRAAYLAYRAQRGGQGQYGMQGAGRCQLTWYAFQDQADALGGCWDVTANSKVGFRALEALVAKYGEEAGAAAFNGSGVAAVAYGEDFVSKAAWWRRRLA